MNNNKTDITIVLDRSGSMSGLVSDTIGGFNTFLKSQRETPGEADITLVQFDHEYLVSYKAQAVEFVKDLCNSTYTPRGNTALNDAVGRSINEAGERFKLMSESERPSKVVFVIITDGQENSSSEFKKETIRKMIKHQEDTYKWQFVFLGANAEAFAESSNLGFGFSNSIQYSPNSAGVTAAYQSLSSNMSMMRCGQSKDMAFSDEDRKQQEALKSK